MSIFTESTVEQATLVWLQGLGYGVLYGPDIAPGEASEERLDYREVLLLGRLRDALIRLNPDAPSEALEEALRKVQQVHGASLIQANRTFHRMLTEGVEVEVLSEGEVRGERIRIVDFDDVTVNDWLAVNQYTVEEGHFNRRPDVVVLLNGIPVAVIELKNAKDEKATIWKAYQQLQTYQQQVSKLFTYNGILIISDGNEARLGALTSPQERFSPWKTIDGYELAPPTANQLEVLLKGAFERRRLLELLRHFIVFEDDGSQIIKKVAAYHQFHAVQKALERTLEASAPEGTRRGGVLWHTQGSGKSLTMLFFAGKLVLHPRMENPTIVVLTDRIDLDDQLFGVFSRSQDLLRQVPVQARDRPHLRELLDVSSGGVVFTTIQKFIPDEKGDNHPELSDRHNIVVLADEAHRGQYGLLEGFARNVRDALPKATFVGFTGTPLELADRDTRLVFGDYIDIYDVQRAVEDGATVPIYYESRLAKLVLDEDETPRLDDEFEEITEAEEVQQREKLKTSWSRLERLVGSRKRLAQVAQDLVSHFERRQQVMDGKAMVVGMSRRICVELYGESIRLRPDWHSDDDSEGTIKVIMTGSASDDDYMQPHIRNKARREAIAKRFKNPEDELKIVVVRDMWLTGFDVPSLHTMYVDKPMQGHSLMQAIARVNRVFRDKPGGLVVDYLGLINRLKQALAFYAESGGKGKAVEVDEDELVAQMLERLEQCRGFFHGQEYLISDFVSGSPTERLNVLPKAQEHLIVQNFREPGSLERFLNISLALSKAFALAGARDEAGAIRNEVVFFQTVRAALNKTTAPSPKTHEDLDHAIRQLVEQAIAPEGVVDIFATVGLSKPDISILSDGFLAEVKDMPQRNLAVELLDKLLNDEIKTRSRKNLVQSKTFSDKLKEALRKYHNRAIETAQVIDELISLAREMREARSRGDDLGLSEDELAFYDALEVNDSAVKVLGDDTLKEIAKELAETVRNNTTIDWARRESIRANMRRMVKRVLRRHGYPPDKRDRATKIVVEQAELLNGELYGTER